MSIRFDKEKNSFTLTTLHTSYQMQVSDLGYLIHLYYGKKTAELMDYLFEPYDVGFSPNPYELRALKGGTADAFPQEYSGANAGDYRVSSVDLISEKGIRGADLRYVDHEIHAGKYAVSGMPSAFDREDTAETLKIHLCDRASGLLVELLYGVFEQEDVITRAARIINTTDTPIRLTKAASACLDLPEGEWDFIHFHGRHTMERQIERVPLMTGIQTAASRRGASSHQQNPFAIVCEREASEDFGSCYGMMLVYSGSHRIDCEKDQTGSVRLVSGIHDDGFSWKLGPGECFETPEVLMTYSGCGFGQLSRQYHRFIRDHICRSKYMHERRPVLINNWEATYFDFNDEKILKIAEQAAELGVEMMVLDDGWFGTRDDDNSGLGDWFVNEKKLVGGLKALIPKINALGMKFGIWVEPEMVNEDSDLYRAHPDWAFKVPGRQPAMSRNQLVLDLSRPEVVDYLYEVLAKLLSENPIDYVKWDMNRHLADIYSAGYPADRQGEVLHRYVLGLYDLYERLTNAFPDVLWEGCAGGGGRFDAAMLYYSPQIWCSDNTDAVERLYIQEGTSYGYPASAVGAHVSAVPNHQTGRTTPFGTRGTVAMSGGFGYELDLNKITEEEKAEVRTQIERYHEYYDMIHHGDYYRLTQDSRKYDHTAWQFVAEDKGSTLVSMVQTAPRPCTGPIRVRLKGLDPDASYEVVRTEVFGCEGGRLKNTRKVFSGEALMNGGVVLPVLSGNYPSLQMYLKRV